MRRFPCDHNRPTAATRHHHMEQHEARKREEGHSNGPSGDWGKNLVEVNPMYSNMVKEDKLQQSKGSEDQR